MAVRKDDKNVPQELNVVELGEMKKKNGLEKNEGTEEKKIAKKKISELSKISAEKAERIKLFLREKSKNGMMQKREKSLMDLCSLKSNQFKVDLERLGERKELKIVKGKLLRSKQTIKGKMKDFFANNQVLFTKMENYLFVMSLMIMFLFLMLINL